MSELIDEIEHLARERVGLMLRRKWRLERLVGVGGMASVYAAVHRNGMRGAVKILHPDLAAFEDARARFLREGYAANAVGHDGAVAVLDDDVTEEGLVFLVMELLDGEAIDLLVQRRRMGRVRAVEAVAIGDQLLDVLAAAHEKGILHRDLKPENLFLTRQGRVKVLDFGIAKVRDLQSQRATATGNVMGTPAFMPPEQALGKWNQVDARSDLWAAGASLYTLLTGKLIHQGETTTQLLLAAATQPAPPIRFVESSVPPKLAAVIDRALAFDREERWPDARAMQRELVAAWGGRGELGTLVDEMRGPAVELHERTVEPPRPIAPSGDESAPVTAAAPSLDGGVLREVPSQPRAVAATIGDGDQATLASPHVFAPTVNLPNRTGSPVSCTLAKRPAPRGRWLRAVAGAALALSIAAAAWLGLRPLRAREPAAPASAAPEAVSHDTASAAPEPVPSIEASAVSSERAAASASVPQPVSRASTGPASKSPPLRPPPSAPASSPAPSAPPPPPPPPDKLIRTW